MKESIDSKSYLLSVPFDAQLEFSPGECRRLLRSWEFRLAPGSGRVSGLSIRDPNPFRYSRLVDSNEQRLGAFVFDRLDWRTS